MVNPAVCIFDRVCDDDLGIMVFHKFCSSVKSPSGLQDQMQSVFS